VLRREVTDRGDIVARASELGVDVAAGAAVIIVRARHFAPADDDWRARVLAAAERAARASAPGSLATVIDDHVVLLVQAERDAEVRRAANAVARELRSSLHGFTFALGHSRPATDPADLYRAGNEALLAANVAEGGTDDAVLAFEETGAYRLLLPAMSEDPAELERFFAECFRVLRPGGRVAIFWPHRHATSGYVIRAAHRLLRRVGPETQMHAPEISLLRSREQARQILARAGLQLTDYEFSARDFWVQAVVVAAKPRP